MFLWPAYIAGHHHHIIIIIIILWHLQHTPLQPQRDPWVPWAGLWGQGPGTNRTRGQAPIGPGARTR
eukprot:6642453-Karenia_brevis.AAC.1